MRDKDLLKLFLASGWEVIRIKGSHHVLKKGEQIEGIPVHGRDVPTGLLNKLLKRAGLNDPRTKKEGAQ